MSATKPLFKYWFPAVLWIALIFLASSDLMAGEQTSRIIGPLLRWLLPGVSDQTVASIHFATRKAAHLAEYGLLAFLIWRGLKYTTRLSPPRAAMATMAACALCASLDEWRQTLTSSRWGTISDVALDTGAAVAMVLVLLWLNKRRGANQAAGPADHPDCPL